MGLFSFSHQLYEPQGNGIDSSNLNRTLLSHDLVDISLSDMKLRTIKLAPPTTSSASPDLTVLSFGVRRDSSPLRLPAPESEIEIAAPDSIPVTASRLAQVVLLRSPPLPPVSYPKPLHGFSEPFEWL